MYKKIYAEALKRLEDSKAEIIKHMTNDLKKHGKPIQIGNMVYGVCEHVGGDVPAYRYATDKDAKLMPIYDSNELFEYGWADFEEVVRIFDVIRKHLLLAK